MLRKDPESPFPDPVPPFPGWQRRVYRLPRAVTQGDIDAFLGEQDLYVRESRTAPVLIVHKFGVLEIHFMIGEKIAEVWFSPDNAAGSAEYLDALFMTRF